MMGEIYVDFVQHVQPGDNEELELRCPICGSKAFVMHDIVDGFDFGWSSGCPRWCLTDKAHPHYDGEPHLTVMGCNSKEDAIEKCKHIFESAEAK